IGVQYRNKLIPCCWSIFWRVALTLLPSRDSDVRRRTTRAHPLLQPFRDSALRLVAIASSKFERSGPSTDVWADPRGNWSDDRRSFDNRCRDRACQKHLWNLASVRLVTEP